MRPAKIICLAVILGGACFVTPGRSSADEPQAPAPDADAQDAIEAQVRDHVAKGKQFHLQKQFALSIREWEAAYRLSPKPTYLFNIATDHYRAGHLKEALAGYRLFLAKEPEHPVPSLRLEANSNIADIQTILRQQAELDREKKRPLWRKPWFWGVLASATVATGVALGVGLGLGLKDTREMISETFPGLPKSSALQLPIPHMR